MANYASEYSDTNIARMTDLYGKSQQAAYDRSMAQLLTSMGGRGTSYGTPYLNKGGQQATQLAGNVAGYEAGLRGQGLEAGRQERLTGEARAYEDPYRKTAQSGYLPGGGATFERERYEKEAPLTERLVGSQERLADIQKYKDIQNLLSGIMGVIPGIGDIWEGLW